MWSWAELKQFVEDTPPAYLVGGGVVIASTIWIIRKQLCRKPRKNYPADVVILHQIGRGPWAPSLSPFVMKLETFLRMAEIPYQNEHGVEMSSKGKWPWITYNGVDLADSQFCIEYLNKEFNVNLNKDVSSLERSISRAFQKMTEEHFFWCFALSLWVYHPDWDLVKACDLPMLAPTMISWTVRKFARAQGLGRHTVQELVAIGQDDLTALSVFLGEKKFFMGDEPSEIDCVMFGFLASTLYHLPKSPLHKYMKEDLQNLTDYCETMKQAYWPDWDECITRGGTCKATK